MFNVLHTVNEVKIHPNIVDKYITATKDDVIKITFTVIQFYQIRWPNNIQSEPELIQYFRICNDLTVQDGLLYFNDRLVVPPS